MLLDGNRLGVALAEEGLCPRNARNVELHSPVRGPITLSYEVLIDEDDIPKLQRALGKLLEAEVTR